MKRPITRSANWNWFLLDWLDEKETLYTINSSKMEIFKYNGSFCNFYPNLPKTFFINKMIKSKAHA